MAVEVVSPVAAAPAPTSKVAEVPMVALEGWYMDTSTEDQRKPHRLEPNESATHDAFENLGVQYFYLLQGADDPLLEKIKTERGYNYFDIIEVSPEKLPNYEVKIKNFFEEHLHLDEEIRLCLEGSGYFDVHDASDRWIRIALPKNWMVILPEGIFHRFTLDENNYIKAMRFFIGDPVWTPFNRLADGQPEGEEALSSRQKYVESFLKTED